MIVNENTVVHITHNDGDAIGCALVVKFAFWEDDLNNYWCEPSEADNKVNELIQKWDEMNIYPGKIFISDISVSAKTWGKLIRIKQNIYEQTGKLMKLKMIDHHVTNPCKHLAHVCVETYLDGTDTLASAALIMLNLPFFRNKISDACKNLPKNFNDKLCYIINEISRYDTWEWRIHPEPRILPESLIANICKIYGPEDTFRILIGYLVEHGEDEISSEEDYYPTSFIANYEATSIKLSKSIENLESFVHITKEGEYIIASFVAENDYTNEIADKINNLYDVDFVRILYPASCKVGFRSAKTDINLGRYAKRLYNGGGHPKASGAKLDLEQFFELYYSVMCSQTLDDAINTERLKKL